MAGNTTFFLEKSWTRYPSSTGSGALLAANWRTMSAG
jgi:hypothetical protein